MGLPDRCVLCKPALIYDLRLTPPYTASLSKSCLSHGRPHLPDSFLSLSLTRGVSARLLRTSSPRSCRWHLGRGMVVDPVDTTGESPPLFSGPVWLYRLNWPPYSQLVRF